MHPKYYQITIIHCRSRGEVPGYVTIQTETLCDAYMNLNLIKYLRATAFYIAFHSFHIGPLTSRNTIRNRGIQLCTHCRCAQLLISDKVSREFPWVMFTLSKHWPSTWCTEINFTRRLHSQKVDKNRAKVANSVSNTLP